MLVQKIALAALIAVASAEEAAYSCSKFKEYVDKNQYDCGVDFQKCQNTYSCHRYVCDGSSEAEKAISKGGYLYELNCGSMAEYDTWMKICELEKELHPSDTNSSIYKAACHGEGDGGCSASLDLKDTLTYEWQLSCSSRGGSDKVDGTTCYEDGKCFWYDGSLLGISVNAGTAVLLMSLVASLVSL